MLNKNKIRHAKIKNTGILFELLTRKLTTDIINNVENSISQHLIHKYFKGDSELGKEYVLYQALCKQRFDTEKKAELFLTEVINAHTKLKHITIKRSKYSLIKEIKENFDINDFFKPKLDNYKLLASIYKIFQSKSLNEDISPESIVTSRYTIIEHILGHNNDNLNDAESDTDEYLKQDEDVRLLSYKILVEKFNEKYSSLDKSQKSLIKEYINNISSVNSLTTYIHSEIPVIQKQLNNSVKNISDKVLIIKINEVSNQLNIIKKLSEYNDNHVLAILNSMELVKELENI